MIAEELMSSHEKVILTLLANGYSIKNISKILNISYKKCILDVKKLCEKFEATNVSNCVCLAFRAGYII